MDDQAVFRALFAANYEDLLRFAERRTHPLGAEDVVADVFLVAWRRLEDVPIPPEEARAWLFGVAHRVLANHRRSDARQQSLQLRVGQVLPPRVAGADEGADVAARLDLARAWNLLSPTDQEALTLTALDGLTGPQAADVLSISTTAFSVRLSRARRRLRLHLAHPAGRASRTSSPFRLLGGSR